jgi:putative tricarboxylic transport membrane protein
LFFDLRGKKAERNNISVQFFGQNTCKFLLAPLLIGLILGPILENNFSLASQLYDGVSFVWERPMTTVLLAIAVLPRQVFCLECQ